ncbi:MAG: RluA family pseudouridine synthase [Parachlamydia sp.]|nr:RluA family pseudouridine synthase [Parachlamydia sp.]
MDIQILYEDNHLLAVNKPAGLLTQPSGTSQDSLEAFYKTWIKEKYQKPGNVFLEAAHRLDKPVSGIVLFARTSKALSRLHASLREKKAVKIYLALVDKLPSRPEGVLEHYLAHDSHHTRLVVGPSAPGAQLARLHYKFLGPRGNGYLLEIHLETGRYHQIRAQLAAAGFPIRGDERYGSHRHLAENQIALHNQRLEIDHPVTHVKLILEAPIPAWG